MTTFEQSLQILCKEFKRTPCTFFHWPTIRYLAFRDTCTRLIASQVQGSERSLIGIYNFYFFLILILKRISLLPSLRPAFRDRIKEKKVFEIVLEK